MSIQNQQELANTRVKLRELEEVLRQTREDESEDAHVRELAVLSLQRRINRFKEEIVRFEVSRAGKADLKH